MHSKVITITLLFTFNTSLSKTDTVRTDSSFYYMTDDCLTDTVFQKLKELVKLAANICFWMNWSCLCFSSHSTGLLIFRGKKSKISWDFQGQIRQKISRFPGIFAGKKVDIRKKNRPISRDFRGRKIKIRRKIGRFCGNLAEKSQISKDFQGQIRGKISWFHGKFRG